MRSDSPTQPSGTAISCIPKPVPSRTKFRIDVVVIRCASRCAESRSGKIVSVTPSFSITRAWSMEITFT